MGLSAYAPLVQAWYGWGCFVALAVTIVAAFWIFYDAGQRGEGSTIIWKVFSIVSFIAVLPSLLLWAVPSLASGGWAAVVEPLAYIGLGGGALALISLVGYVIRAGQQEMMQPCPKCSEPQYPSWDYCPYCAQQEAAQSAFPSPPETMTRSAASPAPVPAPAPPPSPADFREEPAPVYGAPSAPESSVPVEHKTELIEGAGPEELAWIVILSGSHAGKEFRLGETTSIGRSPTNNDVVLDDGAVSRQHAKVRLQEGAFMLHDLGSTGGTLVREDESEEWREIHRYGLKNGDQIKMGRVVLGFMQVTKESE